MGDNAWVKIVRELGPAFRERAQAADENAELVVDNYEALKERKLLSAGVPKEFGGGGASHEELCDMLRVLAHHCPSTSLALSMHTHLVSAAVWRHLHGQPAAPLLQKIAASELVLVSTGAGDWLDSTGRAERVEGGYRVTAKKAFASGSPVGDLVLTSAPYDDPSAGPQVLHFPVPCNAQGVSVGNDWDTLGMRATGSHTLSFDDVFVPDAAVSVKRPRGQWHPSLSVVCTIALPIYFSTYVGIAESAAEHARSSGRSRAKDLRFVFIAGELENQLLTAQTAWRAMIDLARDYAFEPEEQRASRALSHKTIGAAAVRACLDKAVEMSGGSAFFRKSPIERLWRDAQAVQFHPLPEKRQLEFTGRLALGLPPVG